MSYFGTRRFRTSLNKEFSKVTATLINYPDVLTSENVYLSREDRLTILHIACRDENLPMIEKILLFKQKLIHKKFGTSKITPFLISVYKNNAEIVEKILDLVDKPEKCLRHITKKGFNPLTISLARENLYLCRKLLFYLPKNYNFETAAEKSIYFFRPIHLLCLMKCTTKSRRERIQRLLEILVNRGEDIFSLASRKYSILCISLFSKNIDLFHFLVVEFEEQGILNAGKSFQHILHTLVSCLKYFSRDKRMRNLYFNELLFLTTKLVDLHPLHGKRTPICTLLTLSVPISDLILNTFLTDIDQVVISEHNWKTTIFSEIFSSCSLSMFERVLRRAQHLDFSDNKSHLKEILNTVPDLEKRRLVDSALWNLYKHYSVENVEKLKLLLNYGVDINYTVEKTESSWFLENLCFEDILRKNSFRRVVKVAVELGAQLSKKKGYGGPPGPLITLLKNNVHLLRIYAKLNRLDCKYKIKPCAGSAPHRLYGVFHGGPYRGDVACDSCLSLLDLGEGFLQCEGEQCNLMICERCVFVERKDLTLEEFSEKCSGNVRVQNYKYVNFFLSNAGRAISDLKMTEHYGILLDAGLLDERVLFKGAKYCGAKAASDLQYVKHRLRGNS
eukprot:snap_masked-scaffold_3-processed-gene-20.14-mRNA-1 protein AED:1.00 eAED:1.00 QI:0/-1/0/0/-1/1/1/0/616